MAPLYFISVVLYFFILKTDLWQPSLNLLCTRVLKKKRQERKEKKITKKKCIREKKRSATAYNFRKYSIQWTKIHTNSQRKRRKTFDSLNSNVVSAVRRELRATSVCVPKREKKEPGIFILVCVNVRRLAFSLTRLLAWLSSNRTLMKISSEQSS